MRYTFDLVFDINDATVLTVLLTVHGLRLTRRTGLAITQLRILHQPPYYFLQ
jgi:uncharacterized membrane protein YGL010W